MYECWCAGALIKTDTKVSETLSEQLWGEYQTLAKSDQDIKNLYIRMEWVKNMFVASTQIWLNFQLES